jgi:putative sterol carrier protein
VFFAEVASDGLQHALADGLARLVRGASNGRLERILSTPVRRPVLDGIFWQMPRYVNRKAASGVKAIVHWHITDGAGSDGDVYELVLDDGRCAARRGKTSAEPQLTITLEAAEFVRLATGNSDPVKAYFSGKVALGGDIMLAAKLQALFRIPAAGDRRQSTSTVSSSR